MTHCNWSGFARSLLACICLSVFSGHLYCAGKECLLDVLADGFASRTVINIQDDTIYRGKVDDFKITLRPLYGVAPSVTFAGKDAKPYRLDCGEYIYRLESPGFRLSEGYVTLFSSRKTTLVVLLSIGSIAEERTHAKVTFHLPKGESLRDGTIEAWLTAMDGSGTFATSRSDGASPIVEVRRGLYTVIVFHRQHVLIVETVYLPAHDIVVRVDLEKRKLSFGDDQ